MGKKEGVSVWTCKLSVFLVESWNTLRFDRLAKRANEKVPWKLLSSSCKILIDLRVEMVDGRVPVNWFEEMSRNSRLLMFITHCGNSPEKLLELMSNFTKCFVLHNSAQ